MANPVYERPLTTTVFELISAWLVEEDECPKPIHTYCAYEMVVLFIKHIDEMYLASSTGVNKLVFKHYYLKNGQPRDKTL